jgi:predicted transcriptional regulator
MLTLQVDDELETKLRALVEREHTTPELFIQKLINQYSANVEQEDFFSCAGLWKDRDDITQEILREQAWRKK